MGMSGIFGKRKAASSGDGQAGAGDDVVRPIGKADLAERVGLLDDFEDAGLSWFWATDGQGRLIYISKNAAAGFGASKDELLGRPVADLFAGEADVEEDREGRPLAFLLSARSKIGEKPVRLNTEKEIWWSISARPKLDSEGNFLGYRGSAKDITAVYEKQRNASRLAQYDSLTGLSNRYRMTKQLTATLTAYKTAKRSCALLMLDLDRFKAVNDTLGHPAGDELLKQVAQRLERIVDKTGVIGRLGGDEFQVILPDIDDRGKLGDIAARIVQMLSQPYSLDGSRAIIGTSVGIAIAPYDGIDPEELTKAADLALYAAKDGGRGQYRFYSSELQDSARERRDIEEELRDALHRGELEVMFQPYVRSEDHHVKGFEALMRWNHPERGAISPGVFIPIAEDSNLIVELGKWVLRQSCEYAATWPGGIRVSVNVSAQQFTDEEFPTTVATALSATGIDPERLELEITESVLFDSDAVEKTIKQLRKLGVRLSLDDFGTGYSSLSYLSKMQFDKIKIDQSFVRGSTESDNSNSAIVAAIVGLGDALGMEITAEGVETLDELELITKRGATLIQGFVFSQAVTHEEVLAKLSSGDFRYEPNGPDRFRSDRRTVYRKVGVIHEDHRYDAVLRNLSRTGALIEGLLGVPEGTDLVIDLGGGQLAVAKVRRALEASQGVEFEMPLVSDGIDGLVTRHRISPYALAAAGMPLTSLPPGHYQMPEVPEGQKSRPKFMQVDMSKQNAG